MKYNKHYCDAYAKAFGYKQLEYQKNELVYIKKLKEGFIVFDVQKNDKYVNFSFNGAEKIFKVTDLGLALLENMPIAWEAENGNI